MLSLLPLLLTLINLALSLLKSVLSLLKPHLSLVRRAVNTYYYLSATYVVSNSFSVFVIAAIGTAAFVVFVSADGDVANTSGML